jgi:2'-5' RNA ligase
VLSGSAVALVARAVEGRPHPGQRFRHGWVPVGVVSAGAGQSRTQGQAKAIRELEQHIEKLRREGPPPYERTPDRFVETELHARVHGLPIGSRIPPRPERLGYESLPSGHWRNPATGRLHGESGFPMGWMDDVAAAEEYLQQLKDPDYWRAHGDDAAAEIEHLKRRALGLKMRRGRASEAVGESASDEPDATPDASTEDDEHTGAMIALIPTEDDANRLAIEDGEYPEDLHLTLGYLGEATDFDDAGMQAVVDAVTAAFNGMQPVPGTLSGLAILSHGEDGECLVGLVEGEEVMAARKAAVGVMNQIEDLPDQHLPFLSHVTLAYTDDPSILEDYLDRLGDVTFDRVRVAFGQQVTDIPLGVTQEKFNPHQPRDRHGRWSLTAAVIGALKAQGGEQGGADFGDGRYFDWSTYDPETHTYHLEVGDGEDAVRFEVGDYDMEQLFNALSVTQLRDSRTQSGDPNVAALAALGHADHIIFDHSGSSDAYIDWSTRTPDGDYGFGVSNGDNEVEFDLSPVELAKLIASLALSTQTAGVVQEAVVLAALTLVRMVREARSNPAPGRQVISSEGEHEYGLPIGATIPPGMRKLTVAQQAHYAGLGQDDKKRYQAERAKGVAHPQAMKATGSPAVRKATIARKAAPIAAVDAEGRPMPLPSKEERDRAILGVAEYERRLAAKPPARGRATKASRQTALEDLHAAGGQSSHIDANPATLDALERDGHIRREGHVVHLTDAGQEELAKVQAPKKAAPRAAGKAGGAKASPAVARIASAFHEDWRKTRRQADGSFEPRVKKTKDRAWIDAHGADEVDIANTTYVDLPDDWKAENRAAAEVVAGILSRRGGSVDLSDPATREQVGEEIHQAWLARNDWAKGGDLDVPFARLPADEQAKDLDQITVAMKAGPATRKATPPKLAVELKWRVAKRRDGGTYTSKKGHVSEFTHSDRPTSYRAYRGTFGGAADFTDLEEAKRWVADWDGVTPGPAVYGPPAPDAPSPSPAATKVAVAKAASPRLNAEDLVGGAGTDRAVIAEVQDRLDQGEAPADIAKVFREEAARLRGRAAGLPSTGRDQRSPTSGSVHKMATRYEVAAARLEGGLAPSGTPAAKKVAAAKAAPEDAIPADAPPMLRELAQRPLADLLRLAKMFGDSSGANDPVALAHSIRAGRIRAWTVPGDNDPANLTAVANADGEIRIGLRDIDAAKRAPAKAAPRAAKAANADLVRLKREADAEDAAERADGGYVAPRSPRMNTPYAAGFELNRAHDQVQADEALEGLSATELREVAAGKGLAVQGNDVEGLRRQIVEQMAPNRPDWPSEWPTKSPEFLAHVQDMLENGADLNSSWGSKALEGVGLRDLQTIAARYRVSYEGMSKPELMDAIYAAERERRRKPSARKVAPRAAKPTVPSEAMADLTALRAAGLRNTGTFPAHALPSDAVERLRAQGLVRVRRVGGAKSGEMHVELTGAGRRALGGGVGRGVPTTTTPTAVELTAMSTREEAAAALQGLTMAQLRAINPSAGRMAKNKAELIDLIVNATVGHRLDAYAIKGDATLPYGPRPGGVDPKARP